MKVSNLVVVAHPDDEILGFGGAGSKLVSQGEKVYVLILCGNADARTRRPKDHELFEDMTQANLSLGFENPILENFPNLSMNKVAHIDIVQSIEKCIREIQPKRVFTHHPTDLNCDHQIISKACDAAVRLFQRQDDLAEIETYAYMEILSSTDWNLINTPFKPNYFFQIGSEHLKKKIKALEMYRNVMRDYPHPRSNETLSSLATYRGSQVGLDYAESFELVFKREK